MAKLETVSGSPQTCHPRGRFSNYPSIIYNARIQGAFVQIWGYKMPIRRTYRRLAAVVGFMTTIGAGLTQPAFSADWFVAPLTKPATSLTPAGTENDPFASVVAAINSGKVKGGDRILMMPGPHGNLVIKSVPPLADQITIMSQTGRTAQLDSISVSNASNVRFLSLSVWPTDPTIAPRTLVLAAFSTSDIVVEDLVVRSEQGDEAKFASWSADTWLARQISGIKLDGPRSTALSNDLMGIEFGVTLTGSESKAINNSVNFYSGDGLRGLGDKTLIRGNRVTNCIQVDANHADGFQSWAGTSGSVKELVLDSNIILEWTHADRTHPLRCQLQGIGLFDGFYDDLTIVNNLVAATAYHGITVYEARNAVVSNNTVVNAEGVTSKYPWISVRFSTGVLVSNNVAMTFLQSADAGSSIEYRSNSVIGTPGAVFENPFTLDYRPRATSGFIDSADPASASSVDIIGTPRPVGKGPDRGAYEFTEIAGPIGSDPVVTDPVVTDPVVTDPVVTDPVVTDPVVTDPVVTDPVVADPVVTDPVVTDPVVTDPVVTDPVVTDPVRSAPGAKKPVLAKEKDKTLGRLAINSTESLLRTMLGRLMGLSF